MATILTRYFNFFFQYRLMRFLFSGGLSLCLNLMVLYILHGLLNVWYLLASSLAFLVAVGFNFRLQKLWTFRNSRNQRGIYNQMGFFLMANCLSLIFNLFLMYAFVQIISLYYLIAQIVAAMVIAVFTFFAYSFIFSPSFKENVEK